MRNTVLLLLEVIAIPVIEFQVRKLKRLERGLPKNQHTQRNLLNFENWCSGELSKIGHNFRKQSLKSAKNQHTQRKLLNFENWTNGEPQ